MISRLLSFIKSQGFKKYFKNTSWVFAGTVIQNILGLVIGVWLARYLGPERFGVFSYSIAFVSLFATISSLGLNIIVIRELVNDERKRDLLMGTAFVLKLIGSFLVLLLIFLTIQFVNNDLETNTIIFIIASAMIFQSFNVIDFYFQSKVLSKYIVKAKLFSLLLSIGIKITLILNEAPLISFALVLLFDSLVLASGYLYFYFRNNLSFLNWRFNKALAFNLLNDSWPLILSGIVVSIYMKIDQIMIKEMLDNEAVGQYAAAAKLSTAWFFIPTVICSSLFPAIVNAKRKSNILYYKRLQNLYDLMVVISVTIALVMTFLSDWVINLLYGAEYYQSGAVLMIHIWGGVFAFLGFAAGYWYINENLQKYALYKTLLGAIVNIVMNYFIIPKYGIQGAAVATIVSQFVASYLFNLFIKRLRVTFLLQTNSLLIPIRFLGVKFNY